MWSGIQRFNPKVTPGLLVRLAAMFMMTVGAGFIWMASLKPPGSGGHDLSSGTWLGITILFFGTGVLFLRKWAVLLFLFACLAAGGKDLLEAYQRQGHVVASHVTSVGLLCLPAAVLLCFWKHLKWRGRTFV